MTSSPKRQIAFLHGFLGSGDDWRHFSEEALDWNDDRLELAHLDIPVAGRWQTGLEKTARKVKAGAILVGYSMGARIALGCTLDTRLGAELSGLVLISGSPGLEIPEEVALRAKHDESVAMRLADESNAINDFLLDWYHQPVFRSLSQRAVTELVQYRSKLDRNRQAALLRCYSISQQPNYWPRLSEVSKNKPVLFVTGAQDAKYVAMAKRFLNHCAHADLAVIPHAGHNPPLEAPESFARVLEEFVRQCCEWDPQRVS